jgi:hypothetical protein
MSQSSTGRYVESLYVTVCRTLDKSMPYVEFSYNNSYQESLKMAMFKMLYNRRCRTPIFLNEIEERQVFGPDIIQEV